MMPVWSLMSKNCTPPMSLFLSTHPHSTMPSSPTCCALSVPAPCVRAGHVSSAGMSSSLPPACCAATVAVANPCSSCLVADVQGRKRCLHGPVCKLPKPSFGCLWCLHLVEELVMGLTQVSC
ncbi:hypothetical protein DUNSADRAFT_1776 [Dunaliella salina]|uniref:Uncharacterized protein n=1 Tax=Dunaliella salina TaxID=3046 RepID=A0ABQ7GWK9_DUNSA|nr:hypothetical protein DUNSADRAFT_1776 [Dunaliella salina]|eukprot:KAF5838999.1 hypothetical protein DUNSADRAFT_1776 [Dunaliella salina]